MSWTTSPANRSKPILPDLDIIATHTGMVVRKSPKFNPTAFLMTVLCNLMRQRFQSAPDRIRDSIINLTRMPRYLRMHAYSHHPFISREEAGTQFAGRLTRYRNASDVIVLAIPAPPVTGSPSSPDL